MHKKVIWRSLRYIYTHLWPTSTTEMGLGCRLFLLFIARVDIPQFSFLKNHSGSVISLLFFPLLCYQLSLLQLHCTAEWSAHQWGESTCTGVMVPIATVAAFLPLSCGWGCFSVCFLNDLCYMGIFPFSISSKLVKMRIRNKSLQWELFTGYIKSNMFWTGSKRKCILTGKCFGLGC